MSLLSDAMEKCYFLAKTKVPDGYGGYSNKYVPSTEFYCAITFDASMEARRADKEGVTSLYTVTTPRTMTLEYHDVFQRDRDKKIFRVTSDGDDKFTPSSTKLDMRQVTAEEFVIPSEELQSNEQSTGNT